MLSGSTSVVGALVITTLTGNVTDGVFQGQTVVAQLAAPAAEVLLCTAGLATVSTFTHQLTFEILPELA